METTVLSIIELTTQVPSLRKGFKSSITTSTVASPMTPSTTNVQSYSTATEVPSTTTSTMPFSKLPFFHLAKTTSEPLFDDITSTTPSSILNDITSTALLTEYDVSSITTKMPLSKDGKNANVKSTTEVTTSTTIPEAISTTTMTSSTEVYATERDVASADETSLETLDQKVNYS